MMLLSNSIVRRPSGAGIFPLRVSPNGRYIQTAQGDPYWLHGDAGWLMETQLTKAQQYQYLADRRQRGITTILCESAEAFSSSQTPFWKDVNGNIPFTTTDPAGTTAYDSRVEAYWGNNIDNIINMAYGLGMTIAFYPAYFGAPATTEGWRPSIVASNATALRNYGRFLGARYPQGNVLWVMGGDDAGTTGERDLGYNIALGILDYQPNAIILGHPTRTQAETWPFWGPGGQNYPGIRLNTGYSTPTDVVTTVTTAYNRAGPYPVFFQEGYYEGEHATTTNDQIVQTAQAYYSGACGYCMGNVPLYGFGSPAVGGGTPQAVLDGNLDTPCARQMDYFQRLFRSYKSEIGEPKTDTSVVTTAIGTGTAAICPFRASDGTFAQILWNTGNSITVNNTCMSKSTYRIRRYDVGNGTFANLAEGTSFPNTGTQAFAYPGANSVGGTAHILVLD